jgi:hypothetical protein
MTEPCPICAEYRYISLVRVCPICGLPGRLHEIKDAADDFIRRYEFQRLWETGTFEEVWDAIIPLPVDARR